MSNRKRNNIKKVTQPLELYNYIRIRSLFKTIIRDKLQAVFKKRWLIETKSEWKNNPAHGKFLVTNIPFIKTFSEIKKELIENGNLNRFNFSSLATILLNSKYLKIKAQLTIENNYIQPILNIHNKLMKKKLSLENHLYKEYREILINNLVGLNGGNSNSNEDVNELNKKQIEDEINYEYSKNNIKNETIEKEVLLLLNKANRGNFDEAGMIYDNILLMDGISNHVKSLIYFNYTNQLFNLSIELINKITFSSFFHSKYDHKTLVNSLKNAKYMTIYNPNWADSYYLYGKISEKLGSYQIAINAYSTAIHLFDQQEEELSENNIKIKSESELLKLKLSDSLKLRAISTRENKGYRNFNKEAKEKYKTFGNLIQDRLIKFNEFGKTFDNNYINNLFTSINEQSIDIIKSSKNKYQSRFPLKTIGHLVATLISQELCRDENEDGYKESIEILSISISDGFKSCIYSRTFYLLSKCYRAVYISNKELFFEKYQDLSLALLLYASFLPRKYSVKTFINKAWDEMASDNFGLIEAWIELGLVYRYGLLGENIDLEKSIYYLNKAVKSDTKDLSGMALFHLGCMVYHGIVPDGKKDREKALELFKLGATKYNNQECYYKLSSKYLNELTLNFFEGKFKINDPSSTGYESRVENVSIQNYNKEFYAHREVIDFNEVKRLSESKKCLGFEKQMYSNHQKVVKFLLNIDKYSKLSAQQQSSMSISDKIEIIKPLANAYRDLFLYFNVKIPVPKLDITNSLVNEIIEKQPDNLDARICWLGLNRFNQKEKENLNFAKKSIDLCNKLISNTIKSENELDEDVFIKLLKCLEYKYELTFFKYYESVFLYYLGKFQSQVSCLYSKNQNYYSKIPSNYKYVFAFYILNSLIYLDGNSICKIKNYFGTVVVDEKTISILEYWCNIADKFIYDENVPKDHPLIPKFCFILASVYSKLNEFSKYKDLIHKYYNKGIEHQTLLSPILKRESFNIESLKARTNFNIINSRKF